MQTKWRQGSSSNIMFYHVAHVCIKQNAREWKAAFYTTWNQKYPVKNDRLQLSDRQHQLSTDLLSLQHKAYLIHTIFPINNFTKSQPYPPLLSEHVGCHNRGAQIFSRQDKLTVYAYASTTMHCPPHVPCASHEASGWKQALQVTSLTTAWRDKCLWTTTSSYHINRMGIINNLGSMTGDNKQSLNLTYLHALGW